MNNATEAGSAYAGLIQRCRPAAVPQPAPRGPAQAPMIERSRRRSAIYGLSDTMALSGPRQPPAPPLSQQDRVLLELALPLLDAACAHTQGSRSMVLLADAQGLILHAAGDADFLERAAQVSLCPGAVWLEARRGTNAIGLCIVEQEPLCVHGDEHFLREHHFLSCAAAPLFDCRGRLVGVLALAGDCRDCQGQTLALVRMLAQMIEQQLFPALAGHAVLLRFHARPGLAGTLMGGLAACGADGRAVLADRIGLAQLGVSLPQLQTHTFASLFGLSLQALAAQCRAAGSPLQELLLHDGRRVYAHVEWRPGCPAALAPPAATAPPRPVPARLPDAWRRSGLRHLDTGDARMTALIAKLRKVSGSGIPVLISGETGTGKELLAQAIHNDSPRAGRPFVAINCASIPEALIESELFGYGDGAFTGARKKGCAGKIAEASGGTLFLDEIGDMPLALQTRLLRVLQDRTVTPLGGGAAVAVDIELICATNRNLREMIASKSFREDLYYRLNGLVVKLPPLRERSDLAVVVGLILQAEAGGAAPAVAPQVMQIFRRHPWPGNLRQLRSLLRTALLMAGQAVEIGVGHLPDDFLDELDAPVPAAPGVPLATDAGTAPGAALEELELSLIQRTLAEHGGNLSAAARALGISRNTIYRKIDPDKRHAA